MTQRARLQVAASILSATALLVFPSYGHAADGTHDSVMLIAYMSMGMAGIVGIIGWLWWSHDLKRSQRKAGRSSSGLPTPPAEALVERAAPTRPNTGEFRVEPSPTSEQVQLVLRSARSSEERECPKCGRTFPQGLVVCPIDATPLAPLPTRRREPAPTPLDARRPTCDACGRTFEGRVDYCYHDGQELSAASIQPPRSFHVCRTCGFETDEKRTECPHDGSELTEVDPSNDDELQPMIPMMSCTRCGHVAGPAETKCPNDGNMLYPLMNLRMSALPIHGVGPRRKVCTSCGRTYSRAANYCAHDGDKLSPLN